MNNRHMKIDSGNVLKTFLKNVVSESVKNAQKLISEKGVFKDDPEEPASKSSEKISSPTQPQTKDKAAAPKAPPSAGTPAPGSPPAKVEPAPSPTSGAEEKPEKRTRGPNDIKAYISRQLKSMQGTLTVDKITDRLNTIRSGKSLKDEIVAGEMEKYFNDLSTTEREALNTFLLGITFIVNPPNDAGVAPEPSDKNIHMTIDKKDDVAHTPAEPVSPAKKAPTNVNPRRPSPAPRAASAGSIENTDAPVQVKKNVP